MRDSHERLGDEPAQRHRWQVTIQKQQKLLRNHHT